ncbi:putative ribonuclease H-like domain-containing protein [Tanacetum coccineum]
MFTPVSAVGSSYENLGGSIPVNAATLPNDDLSTDPLMPNLEDIADLQDTGIFSGAYDDEVEGAMADFNNLELTTVVSPIPTTRIHKDHPKEQFIGKHAIGTKWVYRNKKDERGIVVRNVARLVAQGYTQEEGINYDEVFAPVAKIEAIRLFLAYASFMGFIVYQMDVKSAFLYGTIEEEVYVCQPPGFEDPQFPDKVYKVEKALYGLHQAPRVCKASTPIETNKALLKDEEAENVDVHLYRSMIGSLMYLTASRPDIMFTVCACARDSPFDLEDFSDSDYAGASLDRKSTTGEVCEGSGQPIDPQHTSTSAQLSNEEPITILSSSKLYNIHKPRKAKRPTKISQSSGPIHLVADETVYKEWEGGEYYSKQRGKEVSKGDVMVLVGY